MPKMIYIYILTSNDLLFLSHVGQGICCDIKDHALQPLDGLPRHAGGCIPKLGIAADVGCGLGGGGRHGPLVLDDGPRYMRWAHWAGEEWGDGAWRPMQRRCSTAYEGLLLSCMEIPCKGS